MQASRIEEVEEPEDDVDADEVPATEQDAGAPDEEDAGDDADE